MSAQRYLEVELVLKLAEVDQFQAVVYCLVIGYSIGRRLSGGLSQPQLCRFLGWDYRKTAQAARASQLATHMYLQQQTGWCLRDERYFPPKDLN